MEISPYHRGMNFFFRASSVLLFYCTFFVAMISSADPDSTWEFVPKHSKDGIVVHKRKADSELIEVNGSGVIDAPMTTVLNVINDNDHRRDWMKSSLSAKIISEFPQKPHSFIFYNGVDLPWPFSDRFFYLILTVRCDGMKFRDKYRIQEEFFQEQKCQPLSSSPLSPPKQVSLEFISDPRLNDPEEYPIPNGTVRVTSMHGHWYVYPMMCDGREQTFVEYQIYADFAGHIPLWLVNREAVGIPFDIIKNLGTYVKSHRLEYDNFENLKTQYPYMFPGCIDK